MSVAQMEVEMVHSAPSFQIIRKRFAEPTALQFVCVCISKTLCIYNFFNIMPHVVEPLLTVFVL
jgi:hypothetical protein